MTTAIFPGSFDPVTLGHVDLIKRARRLCDHLIVAVAVNPDKQGSFTMEERMSMIRGALDGANDGIEIASFMGLTVNFALERGAGFIIRGVRDAQDLGVESSLAWVNEALSPGIETVILLTRPGLSHISSSLVRQAARFGGDISSFVPKCAVDEIMNRLYNKTMQGN